MKTLGEIGLILGVSMLLAFGSYLVRPDALNWSLVEGEIELEQAIAMDGALWIDARAPEDFAEGSHPQAISLNEEDWESGLESLLELWNPDSPMVVYCSSQACLRSHHVAERLREELGVEEVFVLKGGWEALLEGGVIKP